MLFESRHITVTADHGTATLAFGFGGDPVNALDLARLRELDAALRAVATDPTITALVLRSSLPAGFSTGLHYHALTGLAHPGDRSAFSWYGQQVLERLAQLEAVSIAVIDGPCLGAGFELALACDYRLCIARSTTHLGFPERFACFGGTARIQNLAGRRGRDLLASGTTLSGREARRIGLADVACCERRARIELRTLLDRIERRPVKPLRRVDPSGLAAERRAFAAMPAFVPHVSTTLTTVNPIPPFPGVIGLLGNDAFTEQIAVEVALRGGAVYICGNRTGIFAGIERAAERGFVTPLEAEQARVKVRTAESGQGFDRAGLVFVADGQNPFRLAAAVRPRTVVCVIRPTGSEPLAPPAGPSVPFPFPRRLVRISFCDDHRVALFPGQATDADTLATLSSWLKPFDLTSVVFPVAARLLPRAA
jgi:enoyl-CoA hydratase/carnithine racemase